MTSHLFGIIPDTALDSYMDGQHEVVATRSYESQQHTTLDLECWQGIYLETSSLVASWNTSTLSRLSY